MQRCLRGTIHAHIVHNILLGHTWCMLTKYKGTACGSWELKEVECYKQLGDNHQMYP